MAKQPPHPLAVRLADVQRERGISGSEMSRRLQINPSTWTRLMAGDVQPSLRVVQAAVAAFPEVRSFCVELLMIRSDLIEDAEEPAKASA